MKKQINIAVLGNTGIGKTTLLSALTVYAEHLGYGERLDVDEIDVTSIKKDDLVISFAKVDLAADKTYSFYEFDTSADFYKAVLSGAIRIDAAIHMYNTECAFAPFQRNAVRLMKNAGVKTIFGCANPFEFEDAEMLELTDMEYEGTLEDYGFEDCASYHFEVNCEAAAIAYNSDFYQISRLFDCIRENAEASDDAYAPSSLTSEFEAEIYSLRACDGGTNRPILPPSDITFENDSDSYSCTIKTPDAEMLLPGDLYFTEIRMDTPRKIRVGETFRVFKNSQLAAIGKVSKLN